MLQDADRKIYHGGEKKVTTYFPCPPGYHSRKRNHFLKMCRNMFESCNLRFNFVHDHVFRNLRIASSLDLKSRDIHNPFRLNISVHAKVDQIATANVAT